MSVDQLKRLLPFLFGPGDRWTWRMIHVRYGLDGLGAEVSVVRWDWPPRLSVERQLLILWQYAQSNVRFTGVGHTSNVFALVPRVVRQQMYRAGA